MLVLRLTVVVMALVVAAAPAWPQQHDVSQQIDQLPWQSYPTIAALGSVAQITLTRDLRYLAAPDTSRFLELNGNPPRQNKYTVAPRSLQWFAIFTYDAAGHVRDDDHLDPDALLQQLRRQNELNIQERQRLGLPRLRLDGWAIAPHYDPQSRLLEWGTRLINEADGSVIVNYLVRILGRSGVMDGLLVSDPEHLSGNIQAFHAALQGFRFNSGETYTEFRRGDRVAEYGLAALVVGGAAAAAASSGIVLKFGKLLAVGVVGLFAAVGGLLKRLAGKRVSHP